MWFTNVLLSKFLMNRLIKQNKPRTYPRPEEFRRIKIAVEKKTNQPNNGRAQEIEKLKYADSFTDHCSL